MAQENSSVDDLKGTDPNKLEYIKMMIAVVKDDIKTVMLYITLAIGIIVLFLTKIPLQTILELELFYRILVFSGITFLSVSAFFFFLYIRNLHITQMKMARCLASLNALHTRELWAGKSGVWKQHGFKYNLGKFFLTLGTLCFGFILFVIIILKKST